MNLKYNSAENINFIQSTKYNTRVVQKVLSLIQILYSLNSSQICTSLTRTEIETEIGD